MVTATNTNTNWILKNYSASLYIYIPASRHFFIPVKFKKVSGSKYSRDFSLSYNVDISEDPELSLSRSCVVNLIFQVAL